MQVPKGNAGNIVVNTTENVSLDKSAVFSNVGVGGIGNAGDINVTANSIFLTNGAELQSGIVANKINDNFLDSIPSGQGDGGNITLNAEKNITLSGSNDQDAEDGSGIFTDVEETAVGDAGNIELTTGSLFLTDKAILTSRSFGFGNAGDITVNANSINLDHNSKLEALNIPSEDTLTASSGTINLQINDDLILRNNSDISTQASINANGGNINITADAVIAFDDSDIFAFAVDGKGGDIIFDDNLAYFGENFTRNSLTANPDFLNNNSRADINATGAVPGEVSIPDVSFIQNSLNNLPNNSINTDELVANSCVVPLGDRKKGKFFITGTESFPLRPGDALPSKYPTGEVRDVPEHSSWQPGDPIVEPQGAYRLANGKLVLSRECFR